jgi:hypothetical protein
MKTILTWFLAATTLTLTAVCVMQTHKFAGQQTQLTSLKAEVDEKVQQVEALQAAQKRSDQQRRELTDQAEELAGQLQARQLAETNVIAVAPPPPTPVTESEKPDDGKGGLGKMLAKMMQDPDTRKMIRAQQRMMMDQMYAPLVKKMGLTPDEATQFKDLLADNAMKGAEKASSMFGGSGSTNNAESLKAITAEQKTFDEQVKTFLGDDRYAQYKDYQETVSERTLLNQFKMQAGSDYNLNDQQTEALLTFMKEEQKSVAATTGLPLGQTDKDPAKLQSLLSDGKVDDLLKAQETAGQRAYERARTILSPDQLDTFGKYQTNRMQMMRMGMTMMRKMFTPDNPAPGAAPATP